MHVFEGNKAECATLIPVLSAFQARHGVSDLVVAADAGMLSAANLNALEDAGFGFIVGSRITKAPYDLAEHFERHVFGFADGSRVRQRADTQLDAASRAAIVQWRCPTRHAAYCACRQRIV
jgi:hypothetical protein